MKHTSKPSTRSPNKADRLEEFGLSDSGDQWFDTLRDAERSTPLGSLGPYELIDEVSRGGQGIVYRARHEASGRIVAIKRLLAGSFATDSMRRRLQREVDTAASLSHDHIVSPQFLDAEDGQTVLVMDWIEGRHVTTWARQVPHNRAGVLRIVRMHQQICQTVHHAHQRGVIHRDLKPSNILVDEQDKPCVLDFGLAKFVDVVQEEEPPITVTEQFLGTPAYAPPEQLLGQSSGIDVRSDVYAAGVLLYEMLTGRLPYDDVNNAAATLKAIETDRPRSPTSLMRHLDRDIEAIIFKAMARRPEHRYQSMEAFERDLQRYGAGEAIEAQSRGRSYLFLKLLMRHRMAAALTIGTIAATITIALVMSVLYQQSQAHAQHAEIEKNRAIRAQAFLDDVLGSVSAHDMGRDVPMLTVLDRAERRIDSELSDDPLVEAAVRSTFGSTFASLLQFQRAERHLQRAHDLYSHSVDQLDPNAVKTMSRLGLVQARLRKSQAIETLSNALQRTVAIHGKDHAAAVEARVHLALALSRTSESADFQQAETLFVEACHAYETRFAHLKLPYAKALHGYASLLRMAGKDEQALKAFAASFETFRGVSERDLSAYVDMLREYSIFLEQRGLYAQAETVVSESLKYAPKVLGETSTPYILWRLGNLRHQQGAFAESENLYRRSLAISCMRMAEKYPQVSDQLNGFAIQLYGADDLDPKAPYLQVFHMMRDLEGVIDLQLARGLLDVGRLRVDRDDSEFAVKVLRESVDILRSRDEPAPMREAIAMRELATCLIQLERFDEAEPFAVAAFESLAKLKNVHAEKKQALEVVIDLYERWGFPSSASAYRASLADLTQSQ